MPETNAQPAQRPEPPQSRRTRRWKRTAGAALLLLIGGAIVNVAVAWGIAALLVHDSWFDEDDIESPTEWPSYLQQLDWPAPIYAVERKGTGIGVTVIDIYGDDSVPEWKHSMISLDVRQFGVPNRALQWESHGSLSIPGAKEVLATANEDAGLRSGIDISTTSPDGSISERRLPLIPLFPGFINNTLFYALLIWLIFFAPFVARRALRRKRRLCEKCAYPVGTSPVCTECGAAVSPDASEN